MHPLPPLQWIERQASERVRALVAIPGFVISGPRKPDSFYAEVAELVRAAKADRLPSYAQRIAEDFGVPQTTVYRWVREAKRRGLLDEPEVGQ